MGNNDVELEKTILTEKHTNWMWWVIGLVLWFAAYIPFVGFFALIAYSYVVCQLDLVDKTNKAIRQIKAGKEPAKYTDAMTHILLFIVIAVFPFIARLGMEAFVDVATLGIGFILTLIGFGINIALFVYFFSEAKKKYERNMVTLTSKNSSVKDLVQQQGDGEEKSAQAIQPLQKSKFCKKCGFEISPTAKFCKRCGSPVEG